MDLHVHVTTNGKATYQLWYTDPVTERRRWRSTNTTSRREAERAAARWEAELSAATPLDDQRITWTAFVARYQAEHLAGLSPGARATSTTALVQFAELVQPARLAAITPAVLSRWVAKLRQRRTKRKRPLAETTIQTYCKHLRAALGWAHQQHLIPAVPAFPQLRTVHREAAMRGRPITGEEFDRLVAAVPRVLPESADAWQFYIRGLWWSGLRLSESVALSWDQDQPFCVDWSSRPSYRIYGESQKSRRDQLLPMAPEFAEQLATVPADLRRGPVFVLRSPRGRLLRTPDAIGRLVSRVGKTAGIVTQPNRTATAHDLRRSFGTRWASRVRPDVLRQLMRHGSLQTTLTYYVRHTAADLAAEIWDRKVNQTVNPAQTT